MFRSRTFILAKIKRGTLLKESRQCCFRLSSGVYALRPCYAGKDFTAAIYQIPNRTGLGIANLPSGYIDGRVVYGMDGDSSTIYLFLKRGRVPLLKAGKPKCWTVDTTTLPRHYGFKC